MDKYVELAKNAIKEFVINNHIINIPDNLPQEMIDNQKGVFVSIHKHRLTQKMAKNDIDGELRGCIGTFLPTKENIAKEIINNAIAACSQDDRFLPVSQDELNDLKVSVDVLDKPELVSDKLVDMVHLPFDKLDFKKYGVIVGSSDGRTGLLLPDLEGINNVKMQVSIALQKAGIFPDEKFQLYRFKVVRHKNRS